jgi:hypothetical protein
MGGGQPHRVHVGPHLYDVIYDKDAIYKLSVNHGEQCVGHCDVLDLIITIDPDQADSQIRDTLLHEVLHACLDLIGINGDIDADTEEKLVRRLAPILLLVLRDNQQLVSYLTSDQY